MQAEILKYRSGMMGVAAVPGSGKTATLSFLAAQLILEGKIVDEQEILVVTLVNSAVDNFSTRIAGFLQEAGLLAGVGYRVRTLHGLAHDIVRERPDLAGLSEQFSIIDESESDHMLEQITSVYVREHPDLPLSLIDPSIDWASNSKVRKDMNNTLKSLITNFISQAKDLQLEPQEIRNKIERFKITDPLMEMAVEAYVEYQRGLRYRGAVDFSDLVRLADRVLEADHDFCERLQRRWPYILEDEAQDSSQLQEQILRRLVGADGNWVRVGDTNQAIYETFTTASPKFLQDFLRDSHVTACDLANSGRSNRSIIRLANALNTWTRESHPCEALRKSLAIPLIVPAPKGDPQPNPPDHPRAVFIMKTALDSESEIKKVTESLRGWLPENAHKTVAVLCPTAFHAEKMVDALNDAEIPVVEMLKSTQSTRRVTRLLEKVLQYLADPSKGNKLAELFELTLQTSSEFEKYSNQVTELQARIKKTRLIEDLCYPLEHTSWRVCLDSPEIDPELDSKVDQFFVCVRRWHKAAALPIDQLLLTMGADLFTSPQDLALTHKLALLLEFNASIHPEYRLPQFALELAEITSNQRKFAGFSDDDTGFNPEAYKGKVLVTTFHKAKGLEWDRVHLLSVNNYDFPSAQEYDQYIGEKWFIHGRINLEAEVLSKLRALRDEDVAGLFLEPGIATREARLDYCAERLRLLFVGITRARESLIITWNTGRRKDARLAIPLEALHALQEGYNAAA
jgi:DNA helicase-2/ATP-dependent DNA helicase PcrA